MERNLFFAVVVCKHLSNEEKRYAFFKTVPPRTNIATLFDNSGMQHCRFEFALLCPTKKHAIELVNHWNEDFKQNGTYLD